MTTARVIQLPGTPRAPETVLHQALADMDVDGGVIVILLDRDGVATIEASDLSDHELAFASMALENFVRETIFPPAGGDQGDES